MRLLPTVAAVLALSACATPYVQPPLTPPPDFAGPSVQERALVMADGARLPLMRWAPQGEPWAVIVALHGMNDHAASFRLAGPWWAEQGIETWAYDQRGFGAAPGRGQWAGQARMVEDLREAVALARARDASCRHRSRSRSRRRQAHLPRPKCQHTSRRRGCCWGW